MTPPDRRAAALWLLGLALAVAAMGGEPRWTTIPVAVGLLGGVVGGVCLRIRSEVLVYLASSLMLIGGIWQLPWFFVLYAAPHLLPVLGAASSACWVTGGILILGVPKSAAKVD